MPARGQLQQSDACQSKRRCKPAVCLERSRQSAGIIAITAASIGAKRIQEAEEAQEGVDQVDQVKEDERTKRW